MTKACSGAPPHIVTASWSTLLPPSYARIGISRGLPRRQRGFRVFRCLAPGPWFRIADEAEFSRFYEEQLAALDPLAIAQQLSAMIGGRAAVALLCFERPGPGQWCHRSLTAAWLSSAIGEPIPEYGFEHLAQSAHPLLPECRRART